MDGGRPTSVTIPEFGQVGPHRRPSPPYVSPSKVGAAIPPRMSFPPYPLSIPPCPWLRQRRRTSTAVSEATAGLQTSATLGAPKVGRRRIRKFPKAARTAPTVRADKPLRVPAGRHAPPLTQAWPPNTRVWDRKWPRFCTCLLSVDGRTVARPDCDRAESTAENRVADRLRCRTVRYTTSYRVPSSFRARPATGRQRKPKLRCASAHTQRPNANYGGGSTTGYGSINEKRGQVQSTRR